MANTVRNPYSNTAGNVPSSLSNGQIGVNQADGKLFYRDGAGAVQAFSSVRVYETASAFPATGQSNVLYVDSSTSRIWRWESPVYVETGPVGGGGGGGATTDASALTSGTLDDARLSANVVLTGDSRLSNSRTPTSHAASHAAAGSDPLTLSAGQITGLGSLATANSVAYSSLTGTPSSFAPSAHKSTHATGGSDELSLSASQITSGTVATARLASGTASSATYLRGDQTWATLASVTDTIFHPFLLMGG